MEQKKMTEHGPQKGTQTILDLRCAACKRPLFVDDTTAGESACQCPLIIEPEQRLERFRYRERLGCRSQKQRRGA
jgi:hypothetical protein